MIFQFNIHSSIRSDSFNLMPTWLLFGFFSMKWINLVQKIIWVDTEWNFHKLNKLLPFHFRLISNVYRVISFDFDSVIIPNVPINKDFIIDCSFLASWTWFLERWISNEYFRFIIYSRICDMRMARRSWDNFLVWLSRVLICDGFVEKFNSCQDMLDSEFLLDLLNQLGWSLISFAIGLAVD